MRSTAAFFHPSLQQRCGSHASGSPTETYGSCPEASAGIAAPDCARPNERHDFGKFEAHRVRAGPLVPRAARSAFPEEHERPATAKRGGATFNRDHTPYPGKESSMTNATKPITRKPQRTARPATPKPSQRGAPVPRTRRAKSQPGAFGRPARATVAARNDLRDWFTDAPLHRMDAMRMASQLLAAAVQEARAFLDPAGITMALAAIGTVPEMVTGDDLVGKAESILMGVSACEL